MSETVRTRDGQIATIERRGMISNSVLIGRLGDKPTCWHESGRWRWDNEDHPLDILEKS